MATRRALTACARWPNVATQRPQFLTRGLVTESLAQYTPEVVPQETPVQHHNLPTATAPVLTDTFRPSPIHQQPTNPFLSTATCTLHNFPSVEPVAFAQYPGNHLLLPLRRDILHRAVVFEGDATRQGTASTKYRSDVHGSNRKVRPQKGTGRARLGDSKSPMLRGGGVAFGPHPRDFSTDLPRKIYDLAWRTALSYRYRKGELVLIRNNAEIEAEGPGSARWLKDLLRFNKWGNTNGRSLFITSTHRKNLHDALAQPEMGKEAKVLTIHQVDVKDLLEMGRIVIEKNALDRILDNHSSDLRSRVKAVV